MTGHLTQQLKCFQHACCAFILALYAINTWANTTNTTDEELIHAAGKGNLPLVRSILETKHNISQDTINKAFFSSIKIGRKPIVQLLIDSGADINYRGDNDYTALIQAARDGRSHLVKLLLPLDATVNATVTATGETALLLATEKNRKEVVDLLLAANADLNVQRNNDGMTALMLAARGGHQQVVHRLIKAGADVNHQLENGATALMLAAQHGHVDTIYILLAAKADVNIEANNGVTALTLANIHRHIEAAEMLKKAGAR